MKNFFHDPRVNAILALLILANLGTLGLQTSHHHMKYYGVFICTYNDWMLGFFILEILLRWIVEGRAFFRNPWHVIDLIVLMLAALTLGGSILALRILRFFWLIRDMSLSKHFRALFDALFNAIPRVMVVGGMLVFAIYVFSLIAVIEFGQQSPEFASLPEGMATLGKTVLMEHTWSELYNSLAAVHEYAWLFVFPVMILLNFLLLHLVFATLVSALGQSYGVEEESFDVHKFLKGLSPHKSSFLNDREMKHHEILSAVSELKELLEKHKSSNNEGE